MKTPFDRLPTWARWILFLPGTIAVCCVLAGLCSFTFPSYPPGWLIGLMADVTVAISLLVGLAIAPRARCLALIIIWIANTVYSQMVAETSFWRTFAEMMILLWPAHLIAIIAALAFDFGAHFRQPKIPLTSLR